MMSILSANYKTVGLTVPSKTPVCGGRSQRSIEGTWTGKYANKKTFKITVSNVTGFRAKVQYQSGGTSKYPGRADQGQCVPGRRHQVHAAPAHGTALIKNVVTDPASGQTYLDQAYAKRS